MVACPYLLRDTTLSLAAGGHQTSQCNLEAIARAAGGKGVPVCVCVWGGE